MAKLCLNPSTRPDPYPNGGHEAYWMSRIAAAMEPKLESWGVAPASAEEEGCGLSLTLRSHAAPQEIEAKIKGAEVYYYAYSPAGKRAAEIFTQAIKSVYPEPALVESAPTPVPEELRTPKVPALLVKLGRTPKVPALLVKLGYHDNPQDEAWLVNSAGEIAASLAAAAADFMGVEP